LVSIGGNIEKPQFQGGGVDPEIRHYLNLEFEDVDELSESVVEWDLEFRQMERGSFHGSILQVGMSKYLLGQARIARATEQVGMPPAGFRTVVITAQAKGHLRWRNHHVDGRDLMVFPAGGELHAIGDNQFHNLTLSFTEEQFDREARAAGLPLDSSVLNKAEVQRIAPASMARFRRILRSAFDKALRTDGGFVCDPLRAIVEILAENATPRPIPVSRRRDRIMALAVARLREDRKGRLSIQTLAEDLQVSPRTLDTAFRESTGMTPAAYRKSLRLNAVHRDLQRADPAVVRVKDIARANGFEHLSQFATDYRRHFGVVPSKTLAVSPA
jgi:AraC family ethanolamine operon transcriptional activator